METVKGALKNNNDKMSNMARTLLLFLLLLNIVSTDNIDKDVDDDNDDEEETETEEDVQEGESEEDVEENNATETTGETEDLYWVSSAVNDVAYYLRAHKFNDFDRRYYADENTAPKVYIRRLKILVYIFYISFIDYVSSSASLYIFYIFQCDVRGFECFQGPQIVCQQLGLTLTCAQQNAGASSEDNTG